MSRDERAFSDDVQLLLKRYSVAKQKANLYIETLRNESEKLFSHFIRYVKENNGEPRGFPEAVQAFYYDVLNLDCDSHDRALRSLLTRRFRNIMKRYGKDDSKNQVKLDEFML
jgi:hypothetical protein